MAKGVVCQSDLTWVVSIGSRDVFADLHDGVKEGGSTSSQYIP